MRQDIRNEIEAVAFAVAFLLLCILLTSCKGAKCVERTERVCEVHDTLIVSEPDTTSLHALVECDSLGNLLVREIEALQGRHSKSETVVRYRTRKVAEIKTEYVVQRDTVRVPIYGNTMRIVRTVRPQERRNLWYVWLLLGVVLGGVISFKLLR